MVTNLQFNTQFKTVFSAFKDVKVLQFSSMQDAFQGFTDKASVFSSSLRSCSNFMNQTWLLIFAGIDVNWFKCSGKRRKIQETNEKICWDMVLCGTHSWAHIL